MSICGLFSPQTGILDSHNLMQKFISKAQSRGAIISYNSEVIHIDKKPHAFDISIKPRFSKLYINKNFQQTATYTILVYKLSDLEKYLDNVQFELERHKNQFELLLNNRGSRTKEEIRDLIIKFYKMVPKYLRGIKRIGTNMWLTEEDKLELLER